MDAAVIRHPGTPAPRHPGRSVSWSEQRKPTGTEVVRAQFAKVDCDACPVRTACTKATNSKYGRSLTLLAKPQQQALDQRRREQETDEWRAEYGARAGVEDTISQAVRITRIRTTPYNGLAKTRLGYVFAATALNFVRLDAWWTGTPMGTPVSVTSLASTSNWPHDRQDTRRIRQRSPSGGRCLVRGPAEGAGAWSLEGISVPRIVPMFPEAVWLGPPQGADCPGRQSGGPPWRLTDSLWPWTRVSARGTARLMSSSTQFLRTG
ncbi:transposase [Streptomyces sp. NPDC002589]|uniref:transposase n=1 Tax=Streptomyces sp. NPDC002589 TaxID=3154420 RepID=UPI00331D28FE